MSNGTFQNSKCKNLLYQFHKNGLLIFVFKIIKSFYINVKQNYIKFFNLIYKTYVMTIFIKKPVFYQETRRSFLGNCFLNETRVYLNEYGHYSTTGHLILKIYPERIH